MSVILRRPAANRDLVDAYRYYAREAGVRIADQLFGKVEAASTRLAKHPGLGTRYAPDEPYFADLRYLPVAGFRSFLIFYRPIPEGIEIYRVLHGARDVDSILSDEMDVPDDDAGAPK